MGASPHAASRYPQGPLCGQRTRPGGAVANSPANTPNADRSMNKKKNPDLVRNKQYTVWLNKSENQQFQEQLKKANDMAPADFMRSMMCQGMVQAPVKKSERLEARELLRLLIEYRTNFNRISNLMQARNPQLDSLVESTAKEIQRVINMI